MAGWGRCIFGKESDVSGLAGRDMLTIGGWVAARHSLLLSSFRAKRSEDPEASGAREREPVGSTGAPRLFTLGVSPPSRRRWVPGLRLAALTFARNDDS